MHMPVQEVIMSLHAETIDNNNEVFVLRGHVIEVAYVRTGGTYAVIKKKEL